MVADVADGGERVRVVEVAYWCLPQRSSILEGLPSNLPVHILGAEVVSGWYLYCTIYGAMKFIVGVWHELRGSRVSGAGGQACNLNHGTIDIQLTITNYV